MSNCDICAEGYVGSKTTWVPVQERARGTVAAALSPAYYLSVLLSLLSRPEWYPDMRCSSWDRKEARINREKPVLVPEKQSRKSKLGVC